jgi:redox-sensing transcriptional repressor
MSQGTEAVSKACIERLPLYYRALTKFAEQGCDLVSSSELADAVGVKAFQLRKDLSNFGEFGVRGFGYDVRVLMDQLRKILGLSLEWRICIVGAGRLGTALAEYPDFKRQGLIISAIFDNSMDRVGQSIGSDGLFIQNISELKQTVFNSGISMGIITVPSEFAQITAEQLVSAGIRGIWNFAPVKLTVASNVVVHQEDLSVGLLSLSHHLSHHR